MGRRTSQRPLTREWRVAARLVLTLGFVAMIAVAASITAFGKSRGGRANAPFSHAYPPDPAPVERPKVTGPMPSAAHANTVTTKEPIHSFAELAAHVATGTLLHLGGSRWLLRRPLAVAHRGAIDISGGELEIGPGTFLEARARGTLILRGLTVRGVTREGRPLRAPVRGRGFLVARDGGVLRLEHDSIRNLGYLGVVSYGITFRRPGDGSAIRASSIQGNYFGVFISHANGVRIVGNRVADSSVYGIDPYGGSSNVWILDNVVERSGLHGIVLANGVRFSHVEHNVIEGARDHGLVLVKKSDGNMIRANTVLGTFDAIVVTGSSDNTVVGNTVAHAQRFGIRLSYRAVGNRIEANAIRHALVGVYLYAGASRNELRDNRFDGNYENVRVRSDARGNRISPKPMHSELAR